MDLNRPQGGWYRGVPHPGSFKLDHLQPVELIWLQKCPPLTQPPIIKNFFKLGREEGRKEQGLKMGKGISPKVGERQRFLTLVHSNWTICSLLNWFGGKENPPFTKPPPIINHFFSILGREEGGGSENGKSGWDTRAPTLGHSNWTYCILSDWFCCKKKSTFLRMGMKEGENSAQGWIITEMTMTFYATLHYFH